MISIEILSQIEIADLDESVLQRIANRAVERYVDDTNEWIDGGHAFNAHREGGGNLQGSIQPIYGSGGESRVVSNAAYAEFVERGTNASPDPILPIPPRKALKIPVGGTLGYIFRKSARHLGSRPFPFFFADQTNRIQGMQEVALSVLAEVFANG